MDPLMPTLPKRLRPTSATERPTCPSQRPASIPKHAQGHHWLPQISPWGCNPSIRVRTSPCESVRVRTSPYEFVRTSPYESVRTSLYESVRVRSTATREPLPGHAQHPQKNPWKSPVHKILPGESQGFCGEGTGRVVIFTLLIPWEGPFCIVIPK